jgi:serine phosphatase RsbU (regulator of sigma subunit)
MLGISFLNEIAMNKQINTASEVLESMREKVISSLHQTGKIGEAKDGMDIALCVIDTDRKKLQFSGANNPMFFVRNNELTVYKPVRNPIGIYNKEKPFENQDIDIREDDTIYLFSDGYIDQFGGPHNKKFLITNFKTLISDIHHKPMTEQKEIIEKTHLSWRHESDQIDDILIIGLKMKF